MRFLANENFPRTAITALRDASHDVAWIRVEAPGSCDEEVLQRASREERILLTFDKDFGELAFAAKLSPSSGIILFRITLRSPGFIADLVARAIHSREDWVGHFSVVEEKRIRIRPLS